jgi:alkylation response protein AidB-like acyl-CoA dehydrogenase
VGIVAAGAFPFQPATRVEGGYRISARWQYASGSHHATRLAGGVIVMDEGKPVMTEAGRPEIRMLTFPREEAEILDTWHVTGLRGTGSADIVVEDLFVPERASHRMLSEERNASCRGPLYQLPLITVGAMPMASVALGIAQHAVDAFVELSATKAPALTETPLAQRGSTQASFGAAAAALRAARAWHYQVAEDIWGLTAWGESVPLERRIEAQLAGAHVTQTAVSVVEEMQRLAGATAIYAKHPIERCFRDIHTLKQNAGVSHRNLEYAGASLLGQPEANRLASF